MITKLILFLKFCCGWYLWRWQKIRLLIIIFCLFTGQLLAQPAKIGVPIAMDDAYKIYLAMELWYEQPAQLLTFQVDQPANLNGMDEQTLAQYYKLAKANNISSLVSLFTTGDGSRGRLLDRLQEDNSVFSGYSKLQTVSVIYKALWGAYHLLGVTLAGDNQTMDWREDMVCLNNGCTMSNVMDNSTPNERMMEAVLILTKLFLLQDNIDRTKLEAALSRITATQNRLVVLPEFQPEGSQLYPVTFFADLETLGSNNTFRLGNTNNPPTSPEIQVLVDMLKAVQAADTNGLGSVLQNFWTSYPGGEAVRMTKMDTAANNKTLISIAYAWPAFHSRVKEWSAIRIIGIARTEDVIFIFVEPLLANQSSDTIQLFTTVFSEQDQKFKVVTDSDQVIPWYILREAPFLQFIEQKYATVPSP